MDKNKIIVFDNNIKRWGEQSPGCSMNTEEKIKSCITVRKLV